MKIIFTLIATLTLSANVWACQASPESFCSAVNDNRTLIYGKIVDTVPHGVRLAVLNVFRGTEIRDTVTVWNTTYFCMSWTEVGLGSYGLGDTVFFILPLVDSSIHGWDVVGDYRMDTFEEEYLALYVSQDIVNGFISGYSQYWQLQTWEYDLSEFIDWLESGQGCNAIKFVSIDEPSLIDNISIYPNPTIDYIAINNLPMNATLEMLSIDGQHVGDVTLNENRVSTSHLAAGSYLLKISYQGETAFRRIVKY